MRTTAVRMYGAGDLRLESFEIEDRESENIVVRIITDSVCMSTYKELTQGASHKRVPENIHERPIVVGHETAGEIVAVPPRYGDRWSPGDRFVLQPALNDPSFLKGYGAIGYSFESFGGDATITEVPERVLENGCLMPYKGAAFFSGSLAEPMACIIRGVRGMHHSSPGTYQIEMDIKEEGSVAILAGCGPMGLGMIDYLLSRGRRPKRIAVTDIDQPRLDRARSLLAPKAADHGVELSFWNGRGAIVQELNGSFSHGFDDIFVMAPVSALLEQAVELLGEDGCCNFFAGPTKKEMRFPINAYDLHYGRRHFVGTSGSVLEDMKEAVTLIETGAIDPAIMITHVGGINTVVDTVKNLPQIPGGKKLIYTQKEFPLFAIEELESLAKEDENYVPLWKACERHNGVWNVEAEKALLSHLPDYTPA